MRTNRATWTRASSVYALCVVLGTGTFGAIRVLADVPVASGGVRADGIAAVVGGNAPGPGVEVILRSDVLFRARIRLAGRADGSLPTGPVPPRVLRDTLEELIGEVLIAREAVRIHVDSPDEREVAAQRRRLESMAGGPDRLGALRRALGATENEIEVMATRRALVQSFLEANLEGATVVSDGRVAHVHASGEHPFGDRELEEIEQELRAWIARQSLDRAVARWVEVLRNRTTIRVLADY